MADIEAEVAGPFAEVEHLMSLVGNMTALTTLEDEAPSRRRKPKTQVVFWYAGHGLCMPGWVWRDDAGFMLERVGLSRCKRAEMVEHPRPPLALHCKELVAARKAQPCHFGLKYGLSQSRFLHSPTIARVMAKLISPLQMTRGHPQKRFPSFLLNMDVVSWFYVSLPNPTPFFGYFCRETNKKPISRIQGCGNESGFPLHARKPLVLTSSSGPALAWQLPQPFLQLSQIPYHDLPRGNTCFDE